MFFFFRGIKVKRERNQEFNFDRPMFDQQNDNDSLPLCSCAPGRQSISFKHHQRTEVVKKSNIRTGAISETHQTIAIQVSLRELAGLRAVETISD